LPGVFASVVWCSVDASSGPIPVCDQRTPFTSVVRSSSSRTAANMNPVSGSLGMPEVTPTTERLGRARGSLAVLAALAAVGLVFLGTRLAGAPRAAASFTSAPPSVQLPEPAPPKPAPSIAPSSAPAGDAAGPRPARPRSPPRKPQDGVPDRLLGRD
jgi:hypothetical protein